ncbi:hypothetical protein [Natronococcus jeotgali]|uniref:Uncharacterized protein n=1 Tax=Natronococcus jeotgali DSM 18795 TaxID=1227498 RepID=L9XMI0_9EURY|nr:hypothetical protein [Natronococcus jeotgali]ELY62596.1 hypothetical protein C492_07645 [Natronococcus jeotgali DSM 18795]
MTQPDTTTVFAGLDGRADTQLPDWYASSHDVSDSPPSFAEAIRDLPQAIDTEVAYKNPVTGQWVETDRFNAIVEPSRLGDTEVAYKNPVTGQWVETDRFNAIVEPSRLGDCTRADGGSMPGSDSGQVDPLFHVPTDSYTILNPQTVYTPLEPLLRDSELDGTPFVDIIFGEIRQYRAGGEVHMDIMFDGLEATLPGADREPITMGVTSGYDFFGGHAVYVEGFAQDGKCSNSMRALTDKQIVKHVGDVRDFEDWWEQILTQLELVADDLVRFIKDAQEIDLDFTDLPFTIEEFYTLLEFPDYLAERAADDALANATDPFIIDLWTLHSGATYALTHFFRGREGGSLDAYVRTANDILFNPQGTIEQVEHAYETNQENAEGEQKALEGECGLARIEQATADIQADVEQFETREEALRDRFQTAME